MERSTELQDLIRAASEAYSSGDTSFIDRHVSREAGVRLIGSDPNEWFEGEQAAEVLKQEAQQSSIKVSVGEVDVFVEGSVGWASARPTWTFEDDGREVSTRLTAVFHQEDGEWKMVQWHVSVGVANEDLFGG